MRTGKRQPKRRSVRFDTATFMAKIDKRRAELGLIREDLAKITGVHATTQQHLSAGLVKAPGADILVSLLDWLGETDLAPYMIRTNEEDAGE